MTVTPMAPAVRTTDELRETATIAGPELELAPAEAIIEWAVETFGDRFCVTSSMGDAVLAHLASRVSPGIDVVFLDTGYHFVETIGTRDAVAATMPVNVVTLSPTISVRQQDEQYGPDLLARDPDLCCELRKVAAAGRGPGGVRRVGHRAAPRGDAQPGDRTRRRLGRGQAEGQGLTARPLDPSPTSTATSPSTTCWSTPCTYDGYPSIGCWPCTRRVAPGEDARSGRWSGTGKTECGIHS